MKKIKLLYEAPEAETLVIRFGGNFMSTPVSNQGGGFNDPNATIDDQSEEGGSWWGN